MEHINFHFVMDHLKRNNVINKHQHGFRPEYFCQSQLLSLIEDILKAMDNKKQVDLVLLAIDFVRPSTKCPTNAYLLSLTIVHGIQLVTSLNG